MAKDTVGKVALDLATKADSQHSVVEQMEENLTEFEKHVIECAEAGLKVYNSDFYIVVLTKKERLFNNIYRNFFLHRKSCPTPEFDQTVYRYIYQMDALQYLWTIPDKETSIMYTNNALDIHPDEKQLLQFVLDFNDGTLDRYARTLNKEGGDTQFLENLNVQA